MRDVSELLQAQYRRDEVAVHALRARCETIDIFEASAISETDMVRALLDRDSTSIDKHANDGFTPLQLASYFGRDGVVALLLERGADPNAVSGNPMQLCALHSAASGGHAAVAELLIEAGAEIDAQQAGGYTAMDAALQNKDERMLSVLRGFQARNDGF
ncbi:MAG: ankyrin repeat domain-containing protein [Vulcanimicrobiaceae bacterium]